MGEHRRKLARQASKPANIGVQKITELSELYDSPLPIPMEADPLGAAAAEAGASKDSSVKLMISASSYGLQATPIPVLAARAFAPLDKQMSISRAGNKSTCGETGPTQVARVVPRLGNPKTLTKSSTHMKSRRSC